MELQKEIHGADSFAKSMIPFPPSLSPCTWAYFELLPSLLEGFLNNVILISVVWGKMISRLQLVKRRESHSSPRYSPGTPFLADEQVGDYLRRNNVH